MTALRALPSALVLAVVVLTSASTSHAALLAYEPFNYGSLELLNGQNGGQGWGSAWSVGGDGTTWQVSSGGLTYPGLATEGNAVQASGNPQAFRDLNASIGGSGSIYISFLMNQSAAGFGNITLFDEGGVGELFSFGDTYTGSTFSPTYSMYRSSGIGGDGYLDSGISINTTSTQLLVLEIDYSTPEDGANLYFYLNPAIGETAPLPESAIISMATSVLSANFTFNRVRMEGVSTSTLDEIRIGDTFGDVVAVPEPGSVALLGVAGSLCFAVLRRRRGRGSGV